MNSRIWLLGIGLWAVTAVGETLRVASVIDGDTFVAADGRHVRLIGIDTPELAHHRQPEEPLAQQARQVTASLLNQAQLEVTPGQDPLDKYGRTLGYADLPGGRDVAERLLREGLAMVLVMPPNLARIPTYLQWESQARKAGKGIWGMAGLRLLEAEEARQGVGHFRLVRGRVLTTGHSHKTVFLNFGKDYQKDFTLMIPRETWETLFLPQGWSEAGLPGTWLLARGKIHAQGGPAMTVHHPLQLQVIGQP